MSVPVEEAMWPEAPVEGWLETATTLQMWSQIVGKVRLARSPRENHWWHVALYLTARGLTTSAIPDGMGTFQIDFDFLDHRLIIAKSDGRRDEMQLAAARSVAEFYDAFMRRLKALEINVAIWPVPVEVMVAVPFKENGAQCVYVPAVAERMWRILLVADAALKRFRWSFLGKSSPSHFFWGSFDLAMTRFSGRLAPQHPGGVPNLADWVTREAYSHEVWSAGFWPGTAGGFERPAFYAYAYPEPAGFSAAHVQPEAASYDPTLREFLLPYGAVRSLSDPEAAVAAFLQSTYEAAADLGSWDRARLER
jgi:Family of unknown function (DUF5996)